jgi:bifunctional UDP-N-acetylglucosamine pyrophosphorylase/glucosamine-1-phosphate N-acetyltransferase
MSVGVVVLAAGKGTRMRTGKAKVLHSACGRTLLGWILDVSAVLDPGEISVVVGYQADEVSASLPEDAVAVVQEPQNGTGHAAAVGLTGFDQPHDIVVVLPGDMPLIRSETLVSLVAHHTNTGAAATILTVDVDDPSGYGRVVRVDDAVAAIVEERDASPQQRSITEVNTSVYVFNGRLLANALDRIGHDNDQGEQYLTDVVGVLVGDGHRVGTFVADQEEGLGVNSQTQLAEAAAVLRSRINTDLLDAGVWMLDPSRVYVDVDVVIAPGAEIYPDVYLTGNTDIAAGSSIGPGTQIHDSVIGERSTVVNAVLSGATVGADATVGPFAYLRPGAVLADRAKAGAHVEIKNSRVGEGSKVPHLSYVGDATIGKGTNIGAGTIVVNYDGYEKYHTTIGDRVRIGANSMLVAPVTIGDDAYTGAGSVISHDVPDGSLGVERNVQKNITGYAEKRRRRAEEESD